MQQGQSGQQGMMGQLKSVRLASLSNADVRQIQTHLKDIGLYKGNVDGNLGVDTRNALTSYFQSQVSLAQQGRISEGALSGFGFASNEIERVRGIDQGNQGNVRQPTQGNQQQQQQPQR
jgi:peptidoglycan hydrolase-like protein with peptidoglycan-binding domain